MTSDRGNVLIDQNFSPLAADRALAGAGALTSLNAAVMEIAFNATSENGQPLIATIPLRAPEPSVEEILRQGQRDGEFRDFDVGVVADIVRSAVNHAMVLRFRADPTVDLADYADEVMRLFDLGLQA